MTDRVSSLGERLRQRREALGLSQAQAARELDVARTAYRLWEMEAAKPAPDRWRLISRWLGVSVATMLLAEDLVDAEEARQADVISATFGPGGGEPRSPREPGGYFEQERSLIARAEREGRLSRSESAALGQMLERLEVTSNGHRTPRSRSAEFRKELPADVSAPSIARAAVLVAAAGIPQVSLLDAQLLTSDLIANSVVHGPGDADTVTLHVSVGKDVLRVEVGERAAAPSGARGSDAAGGRDLTLVMALASRWGGERAEDRNVTWFELDLPEPGSDPRSSP